MSTTPLRRVLVTGANGLLGVEVCRALDHEGIEPIGAARANSPYILDVTDLEAVSRHLEELQPDAVVHCAAYTGVDAAEDNVDEAYRTNAIGSRMVATACAAFHVPLCAISTDFVFDGGKPEPYTEFDDPNPLSVYGRSKLAGEVAIREAWPLHWIVRTSWLFGHGGKCFPETILRAAESRPELTVVDDQRGTPTYTEDLAASLVSLIQYPVYGTYHVANTADNGSTTWYEFARQALDLAGSPARIRPIATSDWPTRARRPSNSALRSYRFELQSIPTLRPWEEALEEYVRKRKALVKP